MATTTTPSRTHVILQAAQLAASGEIRALRDLAAQRRDALSKDLILRVLLTFLPAGTEPEQYTDYLPELGVNGDSGSDIDVKQERTDEETRRRVRRLRLLPLAYPDHPADEPTDSLTLFMIHRAYQIDAETGSLHLVSRLLAPFVYHSEVLQTWMISNLLPLLRSDYEYYPQSNSPISLEEFAKLDGRVAIQTLLSKAAQKNRPEEKVEIGRDLRGLVGPWMYGETTRKRRKLEFGRRRTTALATNGTRRASEAYLEERSAWSHVNEWISDLGLRDFPRAVDAFVQWDGPGDVDYGDWGEQAQTMNQEMLRETTSQYAQAGLAAIYATNEASLETIVGSHRILQQVASLTGLKEPPDLKRSDNQIISGLSQDYLSGLSQADLLQNALLRPDNSLTSPTEYSVSLFNLILTSCYKLLNLGNIKSSRSVAELCLFGTEASQLADLRRTLYTLKSEKMDENVWSSVRRQLLWLRNWEDQSRSQPEDPRGVFRRIAKADFENELLRAILDGGCYNLAVHVYCRKDDAPLPAETVEKTVLTSALSSYDAASNGNRTRGGVRKASEILSSFRSYFPESERFAQTGALLSATHAMSFYSLTLQHGVPFQPVNIRAHKDSMSLIGKILDQNPRSYTHLDDLLEIGQNLVAAGLPQSGQEGTPSPTAMENSDLQTIVARQRITRMAIEAALAEDDFDTAYSYVVNRLSSAYQPHPDKPDDISWRAAYAAGRYPTSHSGGSSLRRLEQRMELLSQAINLAPTAALSEVLASWQECEQQLIDLIAHDAAEEENWDKQGDQKVPGGSMANSSPVTQKARDPARGAIQEEAPMGLFDVARGAAAALSKNAFPLRGNQTTKAKAALANQPIQTRSLSVGSIEGSSDGSIGGTDAHGRVRKRDMVSSMVTGGLASGIGWVIGESSGSVRSDGNLTNCHPRRSSGATRVTYELAVGDEG